jgi:membrane-associated phospholipid phosphatase
MSHKLFKHYWRFYSYRLSWKIWVFTGFALMLALPKVFNLVQRRGGIRIDDPLIEWLPAYDLSIPIFIALYISWGIFMLRAYSEFHLIFEILKMFVALNILRCFTMLLVPFDPPAAMVELVDPIARIFYGGTHITRDLFFSGHTANTFLIFLLVKKKWDKIITGLVCAFVASGVLIQHVHYTVDVLAGFLITYIVWRFLKK